MLDFKNFLLQLQNIQTSNQLDDSQLKIQAYHVNGLKFWLYRRSDQFTKIIVMYHGGGVHSHAGYQVTAAQKCQADIAVCLVDIREHGQSKTTQPIRFCHEIWEDVDHVLTALKQDFPTVQFELWGHSSGAGMLLNYLTIHQPKHAIQQFTLLVPEFGPFAKLAKPQVSEQKFA